MGEPIDLVELITKLAPIILEARANGWTFHVQSSSDLKGHEYLNLQLWHEPAALTEGPDDAG